MGLWFWNGNQGWEIDKSEINKNGIGPATSNYELGLIRKESNSKIGNPKYKNILYLNVVFVVR